MDDDSRLIDEARKGSQEAMEALVTKYQGMVYRVSYRLAGNAEDAQDITQGTFIKALSALEGFRGEASLSTWLYRICVNQGLKLLGSRRPEGELEEHLSAHEPSALDQMHRAQLSAHLLEGMGGLPPQQRAVMVLRVQEGLTGAQTAQSMGLSEGAVKAHYHLAMKKLRQHMKEKGHDVKA